MEEFDKKDISDQALKTDKVENAEQMADAQKNRELIMMKGDFQEQIAGLKEAIVTTGSTEAKNTIDYAKVAVSPDNINKNTPTDDAIAKSNGFAQHTMNTLSPGSSLASQQGRIGALENINTFAQKTFSVFPPPIRNFFESEYDS